MCLGGPTHCRVGRAGSQFYLSSFMHAVTCRASLSSFMFIMVASYSSSGGDAKSNALMVPLYMRAHTF
jgi:hypothetical protein